MAPFHPASGRTVDVRADMPMNTMSTIKIAMMGHLFGQLYNSRLPATLRYRAGVRIAHKTGDFPPVCGSDVGMHDRISFRRPTS